jgi:hypothetical protein
MSEVKNSVIWTLRDEVSAGSKKLKGELESLGVVGNKSTSKMAQLSNATGGLVNPMTLAAAGVGAVVAISEQAVEAASALRESTSLAGAVFETNAGQMQAWASTTADAFGMAKRESLDLAANFGNTFKNVGLSLDETADKSQVMTRLAADLGSAFNKSGADAALALRSGLLGESEPLRAFGVFLSEAAVQAKALELGIARTGDKLTDAQKVTARYAIIMEDTASVQGMFGKDTDSLADAQKRLSATTENIMAELGTELVPILAQLATTVNDDVIPSLRTVAQVMGDVGGTGVGMGDVLAEAFNSFNVGGDLADQMADDMRDAIERAKLATDGMQRTTSADLGIVEHSLDDLGEEAGQTAQDIRDAARDSKRHFHTMRDSIVADALAVVTGAYNVLDARAGLSAANAEIAAAKRVLASGTASKAEKRDAKDTLRSAGEDRAKYLLELAGAGETSSKLVTSTLKVMKGELKTASREERIATNTTTRAFERLEAAARQARVEIRKTNKEMAAAGARYGGGGGVALAAGGAAEPGNVYTVGEEGPETLVMFGSGGFVIPHAGGRAGMGGGGGGMAPVSIPVILNGREIARIQDERLYYDVQAAVPTFART